MAWLSDPEYLFQQEIKEKKSAGRGAFHKKSGAKSKKCTLPYEYLSKKEREKLNGECKTYKIGSFEVTWDEFKTWPEEFQVKHINSFLNRYDCGLSAISEYVFGHNDKHLWGYLKRKGCLEYINNPPRGRRHEDGDEKLRKAVEESKATIATTKEPEEIQNGSFDDKIDEALSVINFMADQGVPMTPERINEIFEERCGESFAMSLAKATSEHYIPECIKDSENTPEEEMPKTDTTEEEMSKTDTTQHAKAPDSINISTDRENAQYILDLIMDIYGHEDFKIEFWVHKAEQE
jgi:hypothetical protein